MADGAKKSQFSKGKGMREKHMNLLFPQWQGAGRTDELLKGAQEIKEKYLDPSGFTEIAVSGGRNETVENDILGYTTILRQLKDANAVIAAEAPDRLFTIGGGCDVEILPVSYLNHKLGGDLTVLWIDAHGDLNTPESSPSKNFHGMPLRVLLGEGDEQILKTAYSFMKPAQLVMIGQRDLDEPEEKYIAEHRIETIKTEEVNSGADFVLDHIKAKGSDNIYVHIDLDVLDYDEFPYIMVPAPGGIKTERLLELLDRLKTSFKIVGLSLLEYVSSDEEEIKVLSEIVRLGTSL